MSKAWGALALYGRGPRGQPDTGPGWEPSPDAPKEAHGLTRKYRAF